MMSVATARQAVVIDPRLFIVVVVVFAPGKKFLQK